MTLHAALKHALTNAAAALDLPLSWEGEPLIVPATAHAVGSVRYAGTATIALGPDALCRTDGALEVVLYGALAGSDAPVYVQANRLAACFPRGRALDADNGQIVFRTSNIGTSRRDGGRVAVPVGIPFYSIHQGVL